MWLHQLNKWLETPQFFNLSAKVIVFMLASTASIVVIALVAMFLL